MWLAAASAALGWLGAEPAGACVPGPGWGTGFELSPDEMAADVEPPGPVQVEVYIRRGASPRPLPDGSWVSSSCDDLAMLLLRFSGGKDERTGTAELGYQIELRRRPGSPDVWVPRELRPRGGISGAAVGTPSGPPAPQLPPGFETRSRWYVRQSPRPSTPAGTGLDPKIWASYGLEAPQPEAAVPPLPQLDFSWWERGARLSERIDFWLTVTPVDRAGWRGPATWVHVFDAGTGGAEAPAPEPRAIALEDFGLFPPAEQLAKLPAGPTVHAVSGQRGPNGEHYRQLAQGVQSWNGWRARNPGIEVDLFGMSWGESTRLRYLQLAGIDLHGVELRDVLLDYVALRHADLRGARLPRAVFFAADLRGANLTQADLRSADLRLAQLSAARLTGAQLAGATLVDADLHGADLRGAALQRTDLRGARLAGASGLTTEQLAAACTDASTQLPPGVAAPEPCPQSGAPGWRNPRRRHAPAELVQLWFDRTWYRRTEDGQFRSLVTGSYAPDPEHLRRLAQGAAAWNAWRAQRPREVIELSSLGDTDGLDQRFVELSGYDLRGARLVGAVLEYTFLERADLRGARLRGARLQAARLSGADLREADLSKADLRLADLRGAKLRGAVLVGAELAHAALGGADLSGADLRGARLAQARDLVPEQLAAACADASTELPPGLPRPGTAACPAPREPEPAAP